MNRSNKKIRKKTKLDILMAMPLFHKILFSFAVVIFAFYSYLFVLLAILAMLPTIVCFFTSPKQTDKIVIIGFFNLAGLIPYMLKLFTSFETSSTFTYITSSPLTWVAIYGSAGIGLFIYYNLPKLIISAIKSWHDFRLKQIDEHLEKIKKDWGEI